VAGLSGDEDKSSVTRTDGLGRHAVAKLRNVAGNASLRGINPVFQPLKAAPQCFGKVAGRFEDEPLDSFELRVFSWHMVYLRV
jgi:hypothetical protein